MLLTIFKLSDPDFKASQHKTTLFGSLRILILTCNDDKKQYILKYAL